MECGNLQHNEADGCASDCTFYKFYNKQVGEGYEDCENDRFGQTILMVSLLNGTRVILC